MTEFLVAMVALVPLYLGVVYVGRYSDAQQTAALAKLLVTPSFTINAKCVGQAPTKIAQMAGFEIPADAPILVVEPGGGALPLGGDTRIRRQCAEFRSLNTQLCF